MELVWEEDGRENSIEIGPDHPERLIGRHKDCDIVVARPSVSRRHAVFAWSNGSVTVSDNGSTAGTYIDGQKVRRSRVEVGTAVNCGGVIVLLDQGAAKPVSRRSRRPEPEP
ncbi:MAG: pSer/pThr/pTyr-binding forkhead associated (FHA) protein, partial [Myxococcota bacterium]